MDAAHWPQGIGVVKPMEGSNNNNNNNNNNKGMLERRARPQKDQALNCPRCNSTNTKFCYYNNYSLSQPRYFCKTCRRYWTEGGSLRNVPVGGGSRKNKRSSSSSSSTSAINYSSSSLPISSSSAKKVAHDHDHHDLPLPLGFPTTIHHHHQSPSQNPKIIHQGQDLNLAYPPSSAHHQDYDNMISRFVQVPYTSTTTSSDHDRHNKISHVHGQNPSTTTIPTTTTTTSSLQLSAMELLKTGMTSRGLMSSLMAMPVLPDSNNTMFSSSTSGFSLAAQEFKPNSSLSFDLDHGYHDHHHHHHQSGYGSGLHDHNNHGVQQQEISGARLLFPNNDQDLKQQISTTTTTRGTPGDNSTTGTTGYWNGMLGGGSW